MTVEHKCSYSLWHSFLATVIVILVTCNATPVENTQPCPRACICNYTHAKCTEAGGLFNFNVPEVESRIESIDLSNASLRKNQLSYLEKFHNLQTLDLSHNHLTEVNKLPRGIKTLNLSHNNITSAKLSRIPKSVEHLNISNNHITYLPLHFETLKQLRSLDLSANPINCSCDTINVRNWLSKKHIWMHKRVICMAPIELKGKPWLQIKQADVCEVKLSPSKYNWQDIEGNELMQGDQPEGSGDDIEGIKSDNQYGADDEDYDDTPQQEEVKEPLVVSSSVAPLEEDIEDDPDYESDGDEENVVVNDNFIPVHESADVTTLPPDDEEEGSGGGMTPLIDVAPSQSTADFDDTPNTADTDLYYDENQTSSEPTLGTLGIFGVGIDLSSSTTQMPATEEPAEKPSSPAPPVVRVDDEDVETVAPPLDTEKQNVKAASNENNRNTFILLGVLGVLLVGLMIYVAMKDKKSKRNRKSKHDIENTPAQELQDMVKPRPMNGKTEHSPLVQNPSEIKQNGNHDKYPAISPDKIAEVSEEEEQEKPQMTTFKPEEVIEEPIVPETNNNYPVNGDLAEVHKDVPAAQKRYSPVYSPRTPKLDRYSPVYTPEGRVKIKLTETPKPKTPIMVNRTRSRAGDYVYTTPEVIIDPVPNSQENDTTTTTTPTATTNTTH